MPMTITELHDHVGAEIGNVDLTRPLNNAEFALVEKAFYEKSVLVFRGQNLSPENHIAFSRRFGPLEVHILHQYQLTDHSEVLQLSNKTDLEGNPIGLVDAGRYWHTDVSFTETPSMGSFLYAVEVPPKGGDTLFSSQFAAYDALPEYWKVRLENLTALHGLNKTTAPKFTDAQLASVKGVEHPLIRTHPKTGRKALYAGVFVDKVLNVSDAESHEILNYLRSHWARDEFIYRHRWQVGDLVMWDNRSILHHATSFKPQYARHMHRTTVEGERPI